MMVEHDRYRQMVNVARDLADSFNRFERDMERFRKMVAETDDKDSVARAVMEGCNNERRRRAIEAIDERLRRLGIPA